MHLRFCACATLPPLRLALTRTVQSMTMRSGCWRRGEAGRRRGFVARVPLVSPLLPLYPLRGRALHYCELRDLVLSFRSLWRAITCSILRTFERSFSGHLLFTRQASPLTGAVMFGLTTNTACLPLLPSHEPCHAARGTRAACQNATAAGAEEGRRGRSRLRWSYRKGGRRTGCCASLNFRAVTYRTPRVRGKRKTATLPSGALRVKNCIYHANAAYAAYWPVRHTLSTLVMTARGKRAFSRGRRRIKHGRELGVAGEFQLRALALPATMQLHITLVRAPSLVTLSASPASFCLRCCGMGCCQAPCISFLC